MQGLFESINFATLPSAINSKKKKGHDFVTHASLTFHKTLDSAISDSRLDIGSDRACHTITNRKQTDSARGVFVCFVWFGSNRRLDCCCLLVEDFSLSFRHLTFNPASRSGYMSVSNVRKVERERWCRCNQRQHLNLDKMDALNPVVTLHLKTCDNKKYKVSVPKTAYIRDVKAAVQVSRHQTHVYLCPCS